MGLQGKCPEMLMVCYERSVMNRSIMNVVCYEHGLL